MFKYVTSLYDFSGNKSLVMEMCGDHLDFYDRLTKTFYVNAAHIDDLIEVEDEELNKFYLLDIMDKVIELKLDIFEELEKSEVFEYEN